MHAVATAWHTVAKAASAVATFVKNHAATIASFVVSTAVFVGCDAALGAGTFGAGAVAGAAACGALAGAAGNAVSYGITAALKSYANQIREAGLHPASVNERTIAVGQDAAGNLSAGSSNGFDAGQRAEADSLNIRRVPSLFGNHAEEKPDIRRRGKTQWVTIRRSTVHPEPSWR